MLLGCLIVVRMYYFGSRVGSYFQENLRECTAREPRTIVGMYGNVHMRLIARVLLLQALCNLAAALTMAARVKRKAVTFQTRRSV